MVNSDNSGNLDAIFQEFVLKAQEDNNIDNPFELVSQISLWTGQNPTISYQLCQFILNGKFKIADGKEESVIREIVETYLIQEISDESLDNLGDIKEFFYQNRFENFLRKGKGEIAPPHRSYLDFLKEQLSLEEEIVKEIEQEQYKPYTLKETNLKKYQIFVNNLLQEKNTIENEDRENLKSVQRMLGLSDQEIQKIEEQILKGKNTLFRIKNFLNIKKSRNSLIGTVFLVGLVIGGVIGFAISPLIFARENTLIARILFNIPSFEENISLSKILTQRGIAVNSMAFTPDGKTIVIGGQNGKLIVCDIKTGQLIDYQNISNANILSVAISSDGNQIVSGDQDGTLRIWNITKNRQVTLQHPSAIHAIAISKNGENIVSGDNSGLIKIWNVNTQSELISEETIVKDGYTVQVNSLAFHPDRPEIISGSIDGTIKLWNLNTRELLKTFDAGQSIFTISIDKTGQKIFAGLGDGTVNIFEQDSQVKIPLKGGDDKISSLALSQDGMILVTGSNDRTIRVLNLNTLQEIQPLTGHNDYISSVAISPDGKTIVSGSRDKGIKVWQAKTRQ